MIYTTWTDLITAYKAATVTADIQTISTNMQADMTTAGLAAGSVTQVTDWLNQILVTNSFNKNFELLNNAGSLFVYFMGLNPPVAPDEINADLLIIGTLTVQPNAATSGAITTVTITNAANTGQTAGTEIPSTLITTNSREWIGGNIGTQREFLITAPTYNFTVAPSTITDAYTFYVSAPIAGVNATITNLWAAGFNGNIQIKNNLNVLGQAVKIQTQNTGTLGYSIIGVISDDLLSSSGLVVYNSAGGFGGVNTNNTAGLSTQSDQSILTNEKVGGGWAITCGGWQNSDIILQLKALATTGAITQFLVQGKNNLNQTLSTEIPSIKFSIGNRQWATGAITTQREFYITGATYSFVGASTITNAYGFFATAPAAGANATITNNYAAGFSGNVGLTGVLNVGSITTLSTAAWITIAAGTTLKAQMNLPVSTAPTSPNDGDIWREDNTNTGLKIQIAGVTKTIVVA